MRQGKSKMKRIKDSENLYYYEFPELTKEDIRELSKYGLAIANEEIQQQKQSKDDIVVCGTLEDLQDYCKSYLGNYGLAEDFLWKDSEDIEWVVTDSDLYIEKIFDHNPKENGYIDFTFPVKAGKYEIGDQLKRSDIIKFDNAAAKNAAKILSKFVPVEDSKDKYSFKLSKKKNEWDEYVVKCYKNGKYYEKGSYYTDDWEDAVGTLKNYLVPRMKLNFRQEGSVYIADSFIKDIDFSTIMDICYENEPYNGVQLPPFPKTVDLINNLWSKHYPDEDDWTMFIWCEEDKRAIYNLASKEASHFDRLDVINSRARYSKINDIKRVIKEVFNIEPSDYLYDSVDYDKTTSFNKNSVSLIPGDFFTLSTDPEEFYLITGIASSYYYVKNYYYRLTLGGKTGVQYDFTFDEKTLPKEKVERYFETKFNNFAEAKKWLHHQLLINTKHDENTVIIDSVDYDKITSFDKAQVDAYFLLKEERPYAVIYAWTNYKVKHIMDFPMIVQSEEELKEDQNQLEREGRHKSEIVWYVFYYSQLRQIEKSLKERGLIEEEKL